MNATAEVLFLKTFGSVWFSLQTTVIQLRTLTRHQTFLELLSSLYILEHKAGKLKTPTLTTSLLGAAFSLLQSLFHQIMEGWTCQIGTLAGALCYVFGTAAFGI